MTDLFDPTDLNTPQDSISIEDLVGEGKKFKTIEDLAKGKLHADSFIEKLTKENADLRDEINARKKIEDLINPLLDRNPSSTVEDTRGSNEGEPKPTVTPEEIAKLVDAAVSRRETEIVQRRNLEEVKRTLFEQHGNSYPEYLREQAQALGVSTDELTAMAAKNPKVFFRLIGSEVSKPTTQKLDLFAPPSNTVTPPRSGNPNVKNQSYYNNLFRNDPKARLSPDIQREMHDQAMRLGPEFFT